MPLVLRTAGSCRTEHSRLYAAPRPQIHGSRRLRDVFIRYRRFCRWRSLIEHSDGISLNSPLQLVGDLLRDGRFARPAPPCMTGVNGDRSGRGSRHLASSDSSFPTSAVSWLLLIGVEGAGRHTAKWDHVDRSACGIRLSRITPCRVVIKEQAMDVPRRPWLRHPWSPARPDHHPSGELNVDAELRRMRVASRLHDLIYVCKLYWYLRSSGLETPRFQIGKGRVG